MLRTTKQPGLITYEPVVLRRGVSKNKQLYNWYKKIHNDAYNFNSANEILADQNVVPVFPVEFRKEMLITVMDRQGLGVRHWLCVNCFPVAYKGGDDLNASSDESKLIEEMTITYEAAIELIGDSPVDAIQEALGEGNKALAEALGAVVTGAATGAVSSIIGLL